MAHSTLDDHDDPRNATALVSVNAELVPRERAVVSVFDAGFVLGDGVWEGLRISGGHPAFLERHLDRLYEGVAGARAGHRPLARGADGRPVRVADGQRHDRRRARAADGHPRRETDALPGPAGHGRTGDDRDDRRAQAAVARGGRARHHPVHHARAGATRDALDPKLNAHSKLTDVLACIQAYTAGADEALMLDPHGFVASCNSTHLFIVRAGDRHDASGPQVWTSDGGFCLGGITRGNVLRACRDAGITARETTFSLTDVYGATEAFCTGTLAGVVPVREVDGRRIGAGTRGPVVTRLQQLYAALVARDVEGRSAP